MIYLPSVNEIAMIIAQYAIGAAFHDIPDQSYTFTAYLLGFAATQLLLGRLSDIFGRVSILNAALFVFMVGTVLCGLSEVQSKFSPS